MSEILIISFAVLGACLIGVSEVLRYYVEPLAKDENFRRRVNRGWHIYRDLALFSYMLLAWQLPKEIIPILFWIILLFSIHWVISDGVQNLIKGKSFFYTSPYSGNPVEQFGKWYFKIPLLLIGITIKYLEKYLKESNVVKRKNN